jgi:hypothetical protein
MKKQQVEFPWPRTKKNSTRKDKKQFTQTSFNPGQQTEASRQHCQSVVSCEQFSTKAKKTHFRCGYQMTSKDAAD